MWIKDMKITNVFKFICFSQQRETNQDGSNGDAY